MEVNNTFTSLIADLPYPNKKAEAQTASKPQESAILKPEQNNQNSAATNESKSTTTNQSVNILV